MKKAFIWLACVFIIFLIFYFQLPPLNLSSPAFWMFAIDVFILCTCAIVLTSDNRILINKRFNNVLFIRYKRIVISFLTLICVLVLVNFISSPIFNAKEYSKRIEVTEHQDTNVD